MKDNIYRRMTINSWARDWFATISFIVFAAISVAMISLTTMLFMYLPGNHEPAGTIDGRRTDRGVKQGGFRRNYGKYEESWKQEREASVNRWLERDGW